MSGNLGSLKVVLQSNKINTGTVILFHGSGGTGPMLLEWLKFIAGDFSSPHLKFLFPTAPIRPYTPFDGEDSHVWFDRYDITPDVPEHKETLASIDVQIKKLIDKEVEQGIPLNKIIVGGFSMGGALALHTAYRNVPGLAGAIALSSFLNKDSSVFESLKGRPEVAATPLCMHHGDRDDLVPLDWGRTTFESLRSLGVKGEFHVMKNAFHELKKNEIISVLGWIHEILPENK